MIRIVEGPLIHLPPEWTLVFDRQTVGLIKTFIAFGKYKHVRAFAYIPFLHVWIFVDPHFYGTDIIVTAKGRPAHQLLRSWIARGKSDLVKMPVNQDHHRRPAIFGWCVPTIKRLVRLPSCALRPDALFRDCIRHGGQLLSEGKNEAQFSPPKTCKDALEI